MSLMEKKPKQNNKQIFHQNKTVNIASSKQQASKLTNSNDDCIMKPISPGFSIMRIDKHSIMRNIFLFFFFFAFFFFCFFIFI